MRNYAITTDLNSDLSKDYIDKNHIGVIPTFYEIDNVLYGDRVHLKFNDFYRKIQSGYVPRIIECDKERMKNIFRGYLEEGLDILHIGSSRSFYYGYDNLQEALEELRLEFPMAKIVEIDSKTISTGLGLMITSAVAMKKNGRTLDEIVHWIERSRTGFWGMFLLTDLSYLSRIGLMTQRDVVLHRIFRKNPILILNEDGFCNPLKEMKNNRKIFQKMIKMMERRLGTKRDHALQFCILHGDCLEQAKIVSASLNKKYPHSSILIQEANPDIGAMFGKGTIGICIMGEYHDNIGGKYERKKQKIHTARSQKLRFRKGDSSQ